MNPVKLAIIFVFVLCTANAQNSLDSLRIEIQSLQSSYLEKIRIFEENNLFFIIAENIISVGEIRSGKLIYAERKIDSYNIKDIFKIDSINYILLLEKYLLKECVESSDNSDNPNYYSTGNFAKWNLRTNKIDIIFENDFLGEISLYRGQNNFIITSNYSIKGTNGYYKEHIESKIYRINNFTDTSSLELINRVDGSEGGIYGLKGADIFHDTLFFQMEGDQFYLNNQDSLIKFGGPSFLYLFDEGKALTENPNNEKFDNTVSNGHGNSLVYYTYNTSVSQRNDKVSSSKYHWNLFYNYAEPQLEYLLQNLHLNGKLIVSENKESINDFRCFDCLSIFPICNDTVIVVDDLSELIHNNKNWDREINKILANVSRKSGCKELIGGSTQIGWYTSRGLLSDIIFYSDGKLKRIRECDLFFYSRNTNKLFFTDQFSNLISAEIKSNIISNSDTIAFNCDSFYEYDGHIVVSGIKNANSSFKDKIYIDEGLKGIILLNNVNPIFINSDGVFLILNNVENSELFRVRFLPNNNWLVKLPNSPYYMCSKDASKMLHYVTPSLKVIGFEQLDPVYNRPDIVLDSIGKYFGGADAELVANYRESWEKRIDRLGLDKEKLGKGEIAVPDAEIVDAEKIEYENKEGNLSISVKANDPKYPLRRFNVYVNEVPLYGSAGISIAHLNKQQWDTTISVPLSIGENKIQVSVMNELGLENFKYPTYVNYKSDNQTIASKTHYIGIGVNAFQQNEYNLTYCVKDVNDLAAAFGGENTVTKIFTDSEVTRSQILQLKQYLQDSTTVNDKVIISCSSHGLLDDSLNFYLATHDVDFDNPKEKGLKYEELESLLDGISARQKLLLLDACNSGENDKTEMLKKELEQEKATMDSTSYLATRGVIIQLEEENKSNFKKMNELFVNVRNNTGSVIISAAGGQESALEAIEVNGQKIENGAFTYSVLEYLRANEGNTDALTVNQLKKYVENRVEEITNGKQKPTSRQETMEVDWRVR